MCQLSLISQVRHKKTMKNKNVKDFQFNLIKLEFRTHHFCWDERKRFLFIGLPVCLSVSVIKPSSSSSSIRHLAMPLRFYKKAAAHLERWRGGMRWATFGIHMYTRRSFVLLWEALLAELLALLGCEFAYSLTSWSFSYFLWHPSIIMHWIITQKKEINK